jgi:hypothetical protein
MEHEDPTSILRGFSKSHSPLRMPGEEAVKQGLDGDWIPLSSPQWESHLTSAPWEVLLLRQLTNHLLTNQPFLNSCYFVIRKQCCHYDGTFILFIFFQKMGSHYVAQVSLKPKVS